MKYLFDQLSGKTKSGPTHPIRVKVVEFKSGPLSKKSMSFVEISNLISKVCVTKIKFFKKIEKFCSF